MKADRDVLQQFVAESLNEMKRLTALINQRALRSEVPALTQIQVLTDVLDKKADRHNAPEKKEVRSLVRRSRASGACGSK